MKAHRTRGKGHAVKQKFDLLIDQQQGEGKLGPEKTDQQTQTVVCVLVSHLYRAALEVIFQCGMVRVVFVLLQAVQNRLFEELGPWSSAALFRQRTQFLHTRMQANKISLHLLKKWIFIFLGKRRNCPIDKTVPFSFKCATLYHNAYTGTDTSNCIR